VILPARHRLARRHKKEIPLAELAGEAWITAPAGMGWDEMTSRTCRLLGGFDPDVRHRSNDAAITLALVAGGQAVAIFPELPLSSGHRGIAVRQIAGEPVSRGIFAATRTADAARPSTRALLAAVREVASAL